MKRTKFMRNIFVNRCCGGLSKGKINLRPLSFLLFPIFKDTINMSTMVYEISDRIMRDASKGKIIFNKEQLKHAEVMVNESILMMRSVKSHLSYYRKRLNDGRKRKSGMPVRKRAK